MVGEATDVDVVLVDLGELADHLAAKIPTERGAAERQNRARTRRKVIKSTTYIYIYRQETETAKEERDKRRIQ